MATDAQIATRYIARGLALIRAANGMGAGVDRLLLKLAADIRYLLSRGTLSDLGKRALNALLSDIADAIYQRYNAITDRQSVDLAELIDIESEFAQKAGKHNNKPSATSLAGTLSGLLILGTSLKDLWQKLAGDLVFKVSAAVKTASRNTAEVSNTAAIATVFGEARRANEAGLIGNARRAAQVMVHTGVQAASSDARLAAFSANGVKYVEWHAILDAKVCPVCALHAGKLYTLPDVTPVRHDVPYVAIPVHFGCRCLLIPHSGEAPEDGGKDLLQFNDWLLSLTDEQENDFLGKGRAELYRRGVITLNDLLSQGGQLLTLAELRNQS